MTEPERESQPDVPASLDSSERAAPAADHNAVRHGGPAAPAMAADHNARIFIRETERTITIESAGGLGISTVDTDNEEA